MDRLAQEGASSVAEEMEGVLVKGLHRIEVRDDKGNLSEAVLELKYRRLKIRPPVGKQANYSALVLIVIHACERHAPKGREPIEWKLFTDLPVTSREQAIEKLQWYAMCWKIEVFHKILKSGCKVEASGLRTAARLIRLIATCCIVAWRVFWMTMVKRAQPTAAPSVALTQEEIQILDQLRPDKPGAKPAARPLPDYIIKIAKLGGYLGRANDPPLGNIIMWRGLSHLADLTLGFSLHAKLVGN